MLHRMSIQVALGHQCVKHAAIHAHLVSTYHVNVMARDLVTLSALGVPVPVHMASTRVDLVTVGILSQIYYVFPVNLRVHLDSTWMEPVMVPIDKILLYVNPVQSAHQVHLPNPSATGPPDQTWSLAARLDPNRQLQFRQ